SMQKMGHEVRIIFLHPTKPSIHLDRLGNLKVIQRSNGNWPFLMDLAHYWLKVSKIIEEEYQRDPFDVLHWHGMRTGMAIRSSKWIERNVLKVFTNHSSGYLRLRHHWLGKLYFHLAYGHAQAIIGP